MDQAIHGDGGYVRVVTMAYSWHEKLSLQAHHMIYGGAHHVIYKKGFFNQRLDSSLFKFTSGRPE